MTPRAPTAGHEPAPSVWQRHDLLVILAALALLAAGRLTYHTLAQPTLVEAEHLGLRLARPAGWLPPAVVEDEPMPLAVAVGARAGAASRSSDLAQRVVYRSPAPAAAHIEVRAGPRPRHGNLAAAIELVRRVRYGELYRSLDAEVVTIAGRDWLRTRFRHAHKPGRRAAPRIATGLEYAAAQGERLYTVTFHGEDAAVERLAALVAPTLALPGDPGEPMIRPAAALEAGAVATAVMPSAVMIVTVDVVDGQLEPVSGGSGAIVSADGLILTSAHVVRDEHDERFHDLFVIGRFRAPDRAPELVCAGRPERGVMALEQDLALVRCDMDMSGLPWSEESWPAMPLGRSETLVPGEPLHVLGFPDRGGGGLRVTSGEVLGWTEDTAGSRYMRTSAEITPGSSGGAVIDERGALVGVATAYRIRATVSARKGAATGAATDEAFHEAADADLVAPLDSLERQAPVAVERIGMVRPIAYAERLLALAAQDTARRGSAAPPQDELHGARPREPDTQPRPARGMVITSRVVDAANDHPVAGAMVIVFAAGTNARDLDLRRLGEQAITWAQTNEAGEFLVAGPLLRGSRYTVAVLAEDYHPLVGDGALVLPASAPDFFDPWGVIRLAHR